MKGPSDVAFTLVAVLFFIPAVFRPQWVVRFIRARHPRSRPPNEIAVAIMRGCAILGLVGAVYHLAVIAFAAMAL